MTKLFAGFKLVKLPATMLRAIFGPKRDQVTGEWKKLHSEELNDLYCLTICTA